MKRKQYWKRICSILLCLTLILSCLPQVPTVTYAEDVSENEKEVATEAEFMAALRDESVDVIKLKTDITLSRSSDGMDNLFVIPRSVTIRGGGLTIERAGIILGGAVTFERTNIYFSNAVRNVIIANGYPLTLDTVSNNGSSRDIDIFCGGITDYNGGNPNEIPEVGTNAVITIKGTNCLTNDSSDGKGGDIYAGSVSDIGNGLADVANVYSGNATIIIEDGAKGIGKIYGHGARENREGGFPNAWKPSFSLYKVTGEVTISLKGSTTISVDGATGGEKNAAFVYTDTANGNMCSPILKNIASITLVSSVENVRPHLAPVITDKNNCNFSKLTVPENTRLTLANMGDVISMSTFIGGGELVFKEGNQTLSITGEVSGTTNIAVGGVGSDGVSSTGNIFAEQTYVMVHGTSEDYKFELFPNSNNCNMVMENDGNGNWITRVVESDFLITNVSDLPDVKLEASSLLVDIEIPITVSYSDEQDEVHFLGDIPMYVTINGIHTIREYGAYYYTYAETDSNDNLDDDIILWFDGQVDNEFLYITKMGDDPYLTAGRYEISMIIPARYMQDGKSQDNIIIQIII